MLDSSLPAALVVGRTLSSYTTAGVQNNQLTITYTVYNEQADPETGVLLTDTLQPGVTFASASQLPDQSGQNLAWSLGTIQGFDRASVTLTVNLANPTPLQLDSGAHAFGTLDAGPVTDDAPAAVLRAGSVDPALLAATPDANAADPFVQEKAAALDYDPRRIFDYLNTEVGYESYAGSLRGARGTMWSGAGNSLDEASLGVALFRASGIPARYTHGTLPDSLAKQLILSMFPPGVETVSFLPAGTPTADPANDPQLLAETRNHYWAQFDGGAGFVDADAAGLAGAAIATAFAPSTTTFTEVPDALRHKVEVKLNVEKYNQAGAMFGFALSTDTALDQTFNAVELVGKSLTVGQSVSGDQLTTPIFTAKTWTYSPYVLVNENDGTPDDDLLYRGSDYQEAYTNVPLGTQVVTGLFLDVTTLSPESSGPPRSQTVEKTLLDRIGFASRHGGTSSVSLPAGDSPAVTERDVVTLAVSPSRPAPALLAEQSRTLGRLQGDLAAAVATPPAEPTDAARRVLLLT